MPTINLPTLTTLASFKRALQPGAFLQSTHFQLGGPYPRIVASPAKSSVAFKIYNPRYEVSGWTESYLDFGPAKEWRFEGDRAIFQGDGTDEIIYQFIDRATWEALVRSCYPEVAEVLIKAAIATFKLDEAT